MAISYSDFLTQVRNYTEVDSNVLSDSLIDQFISNTELDVAGKVDYDDLRKYATANPVAGQRYLSLPSDTIVLRSVQTIISGTRTFLEKRDTSFVSEFDPDGTQGTPKYYANWDDFTIVLAPTPNAAAAAGETTPAQSPRADAGRRTTPPAASRRSLPAPRVRALTGPAPRLDQWHAGCRQTDWER